MGVQSATTDSNSAESFMLVLTGEMIRAEVLLTDPPAPSYTASAVNVFLTQNTYLQLLKMVHANCLHLTID